MGRLSHTLYVGNLPGDIREREVEDLFYKYGPIVEIELKVPPRPPAFAFVEFQDDRDAEEAIRGRDGYKFDGQRLRVEFAHGGRVSSSVDRHSSYSSGGSRGGPTRRSDYSVYVTGLPSSASWQDLKDHMRRAGDVCFSQVFRDRDGMRGIVDYTNYDDMKYAIKKLDDSLFRNQFSKAYIRVEEYDRRNSYSRSRSGSGSGSPYYSRSSSPSHSNSFDSRSRRFIFFFRVRFFGFLHTPSPRWWSTVAVIDGGGDRWSEEEVVKWWSVSPCSTLLVDKNLSKLSHSVPVSCHSKHGTMFLFCPVQRTKRTLSDLYHNQLVSCSYSPRDKYSRRSPSRSVSSRPGSESSPTPASRSPSRSRTPPSSSHRSRRARSPSRSISRSRSPLVRSD